MKTTPTRLSKFKSNIIFLNKSINRRKSLQWNQPFIYICFMTIAAFMVISSVQYWYVVTFQHQLAEKNQLLSVFEYFKNAIGAIFGLIILNDLRFVVPTQWMTYEIVNSKTKLTIKQHILSSIIVIIPIMTLGGGFLYLGGVLG